MLICDIDDFKRLNDRLGHAAGDELLIGIARVLNDSIRETDFLARYGGEEFVVLAPGTEIEGAVRIAEKIREGVSGGSYILDSTHQLTQGDDLDRRRAVRREPQALLPGRRPGALPREGGRQELRDGRGRRGDALSAAAIFGGVARVVGLTGGIGTGKSVVSAMLAELGACVIDSDAIVHELQGPGQPLLAELAAEFGPGIFRADGSLDRAALGDLVFRDETARKRLNAIVHPAVGRESAQRLAQALASGVPLVVLDIPLLFETRKAGAASKANLGIETIVVVWAPARAAGRAPALAERLRPRRGRAPHRRADPDRREARARAPRHRQLGQPRGHAAPGARALRAADGPRLAAQRRLHRRRELRHRVDGFVRASSRAR